MGFKRFVMTNLFSHHFGQNNGDMSAVRYQFLLCIKTRDQWYDFVTAKRNENEEFVRLGIP